MGRFDLTDFEWRPIQPHLPNKPRGVARVDDRPVLDGIFRVLRSGSRRGDLPERSGPPTTIYNRVTRWWKNGAWANIPPKSNRKDPLCLSKWLYKTRNLVERYFNKIKCYRCIATRCDKLSASYLAALQLVSVRIRLKRYEPTAWYNCWLSSSRPITNP